MAAPRYLRKLGLLGLLETAFIGLMALTVLNYGSPGAAERDAMVLAFAAMAAVSAFRPVGDAVFHVRAVATLMLAGLLAFATLQALPIAAGDFGNWAWDVARTQIASVPSTISIAPGATLEALPALALPFLVFLSASALFNGDAEALLLWRALAYFGAGEAVFGIFQNVFLPNQAFLEAKHWYIGSLTATFINRNTAGTFFGLAFLLNMGLFFYYLRQIRTSDFVANISKFALTRLDILILLHGVVSCCVLIALFLTQSRGANAASFIAAGIAFAVMASRRLTADRSVTIRGAWRMAARGLLGIIGLVLVIQLFAGRVAYRVDGQGTDDIRWCTFASAFESVKDHLTVGAGFGTFQDLFPTYRQSDCSGIEGIWDRAHNFFLEGVLGLGLPFIVAAIVAYWRIASALAHGIRQRNRMRFIPVTTLGAVVLVSLHSLVDFSLQIPGISVYFAAALAAGVSVSFARAREVAGERRASAPRVASSLLIPAD